MQFLEFSNLKWRLNEGKSRIEDVWYECPFCGEAVQEEWKAEMLLEGAWEPVEEKGRPQRRGLRVGFHLSALYSPFLPWYVLAEEFLESKDDPAKLMDFVNSRLAEPFKEVETKRREDDVLKWKVDLPPGVGPENTVAFVAGIDTQRDGFYYTVYAVAKEKTGLNHYRIDYYLVLYGFLRTFEEIDRLVFNTVFRVAGVEGDYRIERAFIDAGGDKTLEVMQFCQSRKPWIFPVRGLASQQVSGAYSERKKDGLVLVNSALIKDEIARRLEYGGLYLHSSTGADFAAQIVAEEKRRVRKGFRYVEEWVQVKKDNHYLDCTVYAICASYHLNCMFRIPMKEAASMQRTVPRSTINDVRPKTSWLERKSGWLR